MEPRLRKPEWLKVKLGDSELYGRTSSLLSEYGVNTICASGKCPNQGECWSRGTATFMIAGDICTRSCRFCNTRSGRPLATDSSEGKKIGDLVRKMNLKHVVLTSVDRDDLSDYGAAHWVSVISDVKELNPAVTMEALIPDFNGEVGLIEMLTSCGVDIVAHNIETVERLTPEVRSVASYHRSLEVIRTISRSGTLTKSGLMVGLGEVFEEVQTTMGHLYESGCRILTIGQYLQPTNKHYPVKRYITPGEFALYEEIGLKMGFIRVESGPLVRSSYHAEKCLSGEQ